MTNPQAVSESCCFPDDSYVFAPDENGFSANERI